MLHPPWLHGTTAIAIAIAIAIIVDPPYDGKCLYTHLYKHVRIRTCPCTSIRARIHIDNTIFAVHVKLIRPNRPSSSILLHRRATRLDDHWPRSLPNCLPSLAIPSRPQFRKCVLEISREHGPGKPKPVSTGQISIDRSHRVTISILFPSLSRLLFTWRLLARTSHPCQMQFQSPLTYTRTYVFHFNFVFYIASMRTDIDIDFPLNRNKMQSLQLCFAFLFFFPRLASPRLASTSFLVIYIATNQLSVTSSLIAIYYEKYIYISIYVQTIRIIN